MVLWWSGYAAALAYYIPNVDDPRISEIVMPLLKSVLWPVAFPISLLRKQINQ